VTLKRDHGLGSNTILHNAVIIAQFSPSARGGAGITRELELPERITPLVERSTANESFPFFAACSDLDAHCSPRSADGFREQEVDVL